jgi:hypothetical protein
LISNESRVSCLPAPCRHFGTLRLTFPCEPDLLKKIDGLANGHCFDSIGIEIGLDFGSESKNMFANFVVVLLDRSRGDLVGGFNREIDPFSPCSIVGVQSSEETWQIHTQEGLQSCDLSRQCKDPLFVPCYQT